MEIFSVNTNNVFAASFAAPAVRTPESQTENRELVQAVRKLNQTEYLGDNSELTIVMDRATRRPLVRIINKETKEIIQQIPPEYVLRMAEELNRL